MLHCKFDLVAASNECHAVVVVADGTSRNQIHSKSDMNIFLEEELGSDSKLPELLDGNQEE